jgi:predicted metal-dependent enzyme (double-stranded beta helix superfamily)
MALTQVAVVDPLIERLRDAVRLREVEAIAKQIKQDLEDFIPAEGLRLPDHFRQPKEGSYARRLLYRDPEMGFTAAVMTWGPGQRTALHDHAGLWCVEGVMEGELEVTRYEMLEEMADGTCRFAQRGAVRAVAGSAGALIPPFEHHVLANNHTEKVALTLHIYGGEMNHCTIFEPLEGDRYRPLSRLLTFDE